MPVGTLQCTVLDCPDPHTLARFYATLLGGEVNRPDPRWACGADWSTLHVAPGQILCFQRVTPYTPPSWPDPHRPAQFHLDVQVGDLAEAGRSARAAGATLLDAETGGRTWHVYADPAGHPFCLVRHTEKQP
ncbi:VOC family protein [Streptomyces sp. VRA16 Mangrove soil]|uniref:VOC family protein n=1 Tax=Streptomyces sp. VRA16 Mangrove soil TaxID=2817434 RepID=UPI001A9E5079|nr:VOC family protein [Streptomyces sp. VRA16 Mangrove soil]MBO1337011.1 VOC family protein [Streptomyces sp. VRA16 Mangrove soil]